MTAASDQTDDDIALAGEYVLRVLSPEQEALFKARLRDEAALRALVADWERDLSLIAQEEVAPVAPPAALLSRLEAELFPGSQRRRFGWGVWGGALGGLAVLGAVAFATFSPYSPLAPTVVTPSGPIYQAQIAAEDSSLVVAARFEGGTNTLVVERQAGAPRPGRTLELWLIAEGAAAPVSLGLIADQTVQLTLATDVQSVFAGGTLAISDEPMGGSPTGTPTGDVLALGAISST